MKPNLTKRLLALLLCCALLLPNLTALAGATEQNDASQSGTGSSANTPLSGISEDGIASLAEGQLILDKTVAAEADHYMLTLEAFSTGSTTQVSAVAPADIVLVLDQSSSMYTPLGWANDRLKVGDCPTIRGTANDVNDVANNVETAFEKSYAIYDFAASAAAEHNKFVADSDYSSELLENASKLGYYVAVHDQYDYIYLVQYAQDSLGRWGWYYVSVDETTRSVDALNYDTVNESSDYSGTGKGYTTTVYIPEYDNLTAAQAVEKDRTFTRGLLTNVTYYKSQYGALVESVESFVEGLKESGVDHRVGIVGFASPFYDGWDHYDGTGLYVDGKFYLYDTDFMYKGTSNGNGTYSFIGGGFDEDAWVGSNVLDPDTSFANSDTIGYALDEQIVKYTYLNGIIGKTETGALTGETMYDDALVSVTTGYSNILNSIGAINANYQQTCPAVGIKIAENVFGARSKETADRDKIIVLFTDGVPTVRYDTNRHHGFSDEVETAAKYWSITGGIEDALNVAEAAKAKGVTIYTVGTASMSSAETIANSNITSAQVLQYLSSNYGGATTTSSYSYYTENNKSKAHYKINVTAEDQNSAQDYAQFASTTDGDSDLNVAFGTIMESITVPMVTLDASATLRDVLSDYFEFLRGTDTKIAVYTAAFNADGTVKTPVLLENAGITFGKTDETSDRYDVVDVTGYNYSEEYYSQTPRTKNGANYYGSKLIVQIPIKVSETFNGGNDVPTNEPESGIYDDENQIVQPFPIPEVDVPGVVTNKYVTPVKGSETELVVTLEAYATGSANTINITKPADIVLVLDHSASMRTPAGATKILDTNSFYDGPGKITDQSKLDTELGKHIGYYIGHSKAYNTWWVLRFVEETKKWEGYSIPNTECFVDPTKAPNPYPFDENYYNGTQHTKKLTWDDGKIDSNLVFYKTQYAMLYDAIKVFAEDLKDSGVPHNVAIVAFAGRDTAGTGLYVGGVDSKGAAQEFKIYDRALYHTNTTQARRNELYQLAMKNVQDPNEYDELLSNIESINTNDSFTCPAAGLQLANEVYAANAIDSLDRDRIVVLFTDGIPNKTFNNERIGEVDAQGITVTQDYIYNDIVTKAYETKHTYGAKLYSISTATLGTDANRNFLKYASSDYPDATSYATPGAQLEEKLKYTSEVDGAEALSVSFGNITKEGSSTTVTLDDGTVLLEILTKYFRLNGDNAVTISTQAYDGNGGWGPKIPLPSAVYKLSSTQGNEEDAILDTIEVSGFHYSEEYIADIARDKDGKEYYGSKLVVDVAVKTRDGFWGGNNIPTNGADTGLYSKDEVIQKFPQPEANMPITPTISADDVTIYYGGDVSESDLGITVEINGVEVTINPDGTFSPKESWMSEFATLTWADPSMNPADSNDPTKNTQKNTHAYTVVLNPIYDGDSNRTDSSGSVGGDAVEQDQVKATDTGTVNILVPVLSFQDSTIEYGTTPDQNYYDDNDKVIPEGSSTKNPGVTWVLIDTNTAPDDTVTVTGTEPELTITYTPVGNTAGDPSKNFKVDTKIDVNVTSSNTDGNIMDVIIFQWTECEHSFDGEEGTHDIGTHVGTADSHEFWIHVGTYGVEDMIIIDFGLDVNINVMTNDHILSSGTTTLVGLASTANGAYGPTFIGKYGVATIVDGKVTYVLNKKGNADVGTLSGMEMSEKESFYYVLAYTLDGEVKYYYAPIHVIPATIIYYEDNFIDYSVSTKNEVIRIPVIVRVPDNWTDPALYAWDENGAPIQNWPGIAMQRVEGEDNWFYGYITPDQMHFIVNYKVNDQTTYQTVNLDVDHNRSALGVWAVLANGANGYGQWEATVGYAQGEAPAAPEYKDAHYTIHVQIPDGWSNASVWAWDFTSAFPAWPGRPLVSEGNGWYTADIPVFAKKFLIAGNDGAVQTIDYVEGNGTEQWIVVDSNVVDGNKLGLTVSTTAPEGYKAPPAYTITPGGWTQDGVTATGPQQEDRPGEGLNDIDASKIYGYDNAYTSMSQHSYGSAMKVNVKNGKYATAKFSFRGTGFDMISLTSCTTGTIIVKVTDKDGNYVVNYMVDTYYGYVFADTDDDGVADSWIVNTDAEDALYQVPVIKVDLNGVKKADDTCYGYGYYNVEIVISYAPLFDHGQCRCEENCDGCYDFYLDAIRIYDPADNGANDSVIKDAYISDDEYKPTYEELRNQLIGVDEFNSLGDKDSTIGVVFIDGNSSLSNSEGGANGGSKPIAGKSPAVTEYANYGPNNELYLAPDQAVAFNLNTVANLKSVHLALKSVGGSATISVYGVDADGTITHALQNEKIETATDLYYSIKSLVGKTVVIRNTGESGILSITNLKTTYTGTLSGQSRQVMSVSQSGVALALASMDETDPAPVEPSTGAIVPGNATLVLKDQVQVNIYFAVNGLSAAPADMGLIIFSGENADGTIENANAVIPGAVYDADTGLYMVHTNGIAAKNLGDEIWFRIYVKQADGTYAYSKLLSYSPKAYAESILSGEFDTGLKALVVAMLNYGAAAQEFFGYKTDALVNADLTAEQQSLVAPYSADMIADVKSVDSNKVGAFIANGGYSAKYPSVICGGTLAINYTFVPSNKVDGEVKFYYWNEAAYNNAEVLTAENATGVLTMVDNRAVVDGIAAKDLDSTIYVAAVYESEGVSYCTGVLAYSVGAYCVSQANGSDAAVSQIVESTAVYGSYAKAFFKG